MSIASFFQALILSFLAVRPVADAAVLVFDFMFIGFEVYTAFLRREILFLL
jgi:hypothetical protein